jgi:hypothetical protein
LGYKSKTQEKNLAWMLPRPKPDHYKGGMPLYCEDWLVELSQDILDNKNLDILNVFCGMNKYGDRVDLNPEVNPLYLVDVHKMTQIINKKYDFILADPPYSDEESAELYNMPKLNYKKWTFECDKLLKVGGLLAVYHKYLMPNPFPDRYHVEKRVFVGNRTYHLPRVVVFFQKDL